MNLNFERTRNLLDNFHFQAVFIEELGWDLPQSQKVESLEIEDQIYNYSRIAEAQNVIIFEVTSENGLIPEGKIRQEIHQKIEQKFAENLLIFVDENRSRSLWYWVKRDNKKRYIRDHLYVKGQPGDLFLSKLGALVIDITELEDENLTVVDIAKKLKAGFDVEKITKKFYQEFQQEHLLFLDLIEGIDNENDCRWYTSVLLNRLMFVYFLQRKGFLDNGNLDYLQTKLEESKTRGKNQYYSEFLQALFFEGFAKKEGERKDNINDLIGKVKYLNGGLFLKHSLELKYPKIKIKDSAFEGVLNLFSKYSWNLDDTPEGKDDEINPDVLGYIFEKYINQKAFGAYYTRPEITEYLCDKTINKFIVNKINELTNSNYQNINDLILNLDYKLCDKLINEVLPNLSLLDPACGSGAFLIAAMKTLISIYSAVIGTIKLTGTHQLKQWLEAIENSHPSLSYYIKKRIITDNLYGVDIMEEATEIAKLRLFLALVSSAQNEEELEPLPNIDFNIMAGNSLIGLINVDGDAFNQKIPPSPPSKGGNQDKITSKGGDQDKITSKEGQKVPLSKGDLGGSITIQGSFLNQLAASEYQAILAQKNASIKKYKEHAFKAGKIEDTEQETRLQMLRDDINNLNRQSLEKLNQLLLDEFSTKLGIKYEEVQLTGKAKKRLLTINDIAVLKPFHWGYHFDEIINKGGFDIILGNPPWEVFQTNEKEFFQQYSSSIQKNKLRIEDWDKQREILLKDTIIQEEWLKYASNFPHQWLYFKKAEQYKNQITLYNEKAVGNKPNLYSLFLEQCVNLLAKNGECGIVIPSGIYTDLGTKQLREMLFSQTKITGLFCFENRKAIFEGVDSRFKFVILTFENNPPQPPFKRGEENKEKSPENSPLSKGGKGGFNGYLTQSFPAKFMRHNVAELMNFPDEETIKINVDLIKKLSPDSLSIMEFKSDLDITIAQKMSKFPLLGEEIEDKWNLKLTREFDMTNDSYLFKTEPAKGRLPLYEGKMIHQFNHNFALPKYWIDEAEGRKAILGKKGVDHGQILDYQCYRLGFRDIASSTNERTLISSIIPKNVFFGHSMNASIIFYENSQQEKIKKSEMLFCVACLNSFVFDFCIRQKVTANLTIFYIYQTPVPRLIEGDQYFQEIVERAGKLICTTPEYEELAQEIGLIPPNPPSKGGNQNVVTSKEGNQKVPLSKGDLGGSKYGVTDDTERLKIRAEIDAMVAHLYGLNELELKHILSTFPIVSETVKIAVLNAYRDVKLGLIK